MCENYRDGADVEEFLISIGISFHHLNPQQHQIEANLIHAKCHEELVVIIVDNGDEVAADLLHIWTSLSSSNRLYLMLNLCANYLINVQNPSQRLHRLMIQSIELIGYQEFEQVRVKGFVELLNNLHIVGKDKKTKWIRLLLETIETLRRIQNLSHQY